MATPERNRLSEGSIEASECLKNWWDRGLITQQEDAEVTHEGSDIEGESESELRPAVRSLLRRGRANLYSTYPFLYIIY
jgi:hypothetical protein